MSDERMSKPESGKPMFVCDVCDFATDNLAEFQAKVCIPGVEHQVAGVSAQGSQTEFPPLVDFEPHKSGGVTAIVGGFSFRAANEGEAGSRLRKYLVAECMKLPSRFTAEEQLANLKLAISARGSEPSHVLYKTSDLDAPDSIKDCNGEVVLDLCRRCEKGEIDLTGECSPSVSTGEVEAKDVVHSLLMGQGNFSCRCGAKMPGINNWAPSNGRNWYIGHLEQTIADQKKRIAALEGK